MFRLKKVGKPVVLDSQCFYGIFQFTGDGKNQVISKEDIYYRAQTNPNVLYRINDVDPSSEKFIQYSVISREYTSLPKVQKYVIVEEVKSKDKKEKKKKKEIKKLSKPEICTKEFPENSTIQEIQYYKKPEDEKDVPKNKTLLVMSKGLRHVLMLLDWRGIHKK